MPGGVLRLLVGWRVPSRLLGFCAGGRLIQAELVLVDAHHDHLGCKAREAGPVYKNPCPVHTGVGKRGARAWS